MNKTKKIALSLVTLSLIILPLAALAYTAPTSTPGDQNLNVGGIVSNIVNKLWIVFAGIAVIMFVYAGVMFLTANGDPEKIKLARTAAIWGVAGVVVMILAFSIFGVAGNIISGS